MRSFVARWSCLSCVLGLCLGVWPAASQGRRRQARRASDTKHHALVVDPHHLAVRKELQEGVGVDMLTTRATKELENSPRSIVVGLVALDVPKGLMSLNT